MITWAGAGGSGSGGSGGGGSGDGDPGDANTGGGGAGGADSGPAGAPGGSGVVIIAYVDTFDDLSSVANALTVNGSTGNTTPNTARSGYKVYKFTAGTGAIVF